MKKLSPRTKGILCILAAALSFSLMNTFVRLSGPIPSMQKAFFRNFVAMLFSFAILLRSRGPFRPPEKRHWLLLLSRAAFGTLGLLCNFYAVDHLNISDASMLNKLSPFFAILVCRFLLSERLTPFQVLSVAGASGAAMLIIKPNPANMALIPSLVGLLGGFGAGVAYSFVRLMSKKGISSSLIVFVFSTFSCLMCLPYFLAVHAPMSPGQVGCLLLAGTFGCTGQFSITSAYSFAPARDISVYDYTQVIFSALLGWMFFSQLPDLLSVLGYLVICGMGVAMFLYQRRHPAS